MCECLEHSNERCANPLCSNFDERTAFELEQHLYNTYVLPQEIAEWRALEPNFKNQLNDYNYYTITFDLRGFNVTDKFLQTAYKKLQKYTKAIMMSANYEESDSDDPFPHCHIFLITKLKSEHIKCSHINNNFLNKYNVDKNGPKYMARACHYKKQLYGMSQLKMFQYCRKGLKEQVKHAPYEYGINPEPHRFTGQISFE